MTHDTFLALGAAALVGVAVATGGGFFVGYRMGASRPARLLRRARRNTEHCLTEAASAIDLAGRFCEAVLSSARIVETQVAPLVERQHRLSDTIGRLLSSTKSAPAREPVEVSWQREPVESETQLPDRTGFEANVTKIASPDRPRGGVLLVSLDGLDRLRGRIGPTGLSEVRRTVARVLCRAGREQDLACILDGNSFAVLLPDADPEDALGQAARIRDVFRGHPFRLGIEGPEVLVTASYGFTPVLPADEPRLVLDRVEAAVARARRWGRNRFYAYDPAASRLVQVPDATKPRRAVLTSA